MDIQAIKPLLKEGESEVIEFKTSTTQLKRAFETICAFLNGKGGTVLIGINDKGKIVGQDITENTRQEIARELGKLEPTISLDITYLPLETGKFVISLKTEQNIHAPYVYNGRAFQRNQSTTIRMSQHRYEQLLVVRGQLDYSWEEIVTHEYSIDDLDHEEIYKTVSDGIRKNRIPASTQREGITQILERLNLIEKGNLKRAALVLYARQESMKFMQCMMKMARFKGINKLGDFIDNQQIQGNAFSLFSEADAFLRRHIPVSSFFKPDQYKRIDKPALPVMAVREALVNAICHRNYADRHTDIALAIYDDRLELWNSGSLLNNLTIENLKEKHESVLRNKLIANTFYIRGWIEKWGIGTNKIIDLCKENDIPEPYFEKRSGGISVTFKFQDPIGTMRKKKPIYSLLSMRQKEILSVIKNYRIATIQQIIQGLKNPPSQRMIQRDLHFLREEGLIDLKGTSKKATWVLKSDA